MLKEWCSKYTVSIKRIIRCQQIFWQFGIILVSQSSFLITPSLQRDFRLILLFSHSSLWWEYLFLTFQFLVVSLFVFACSHALCTITISSYSTFQWYHSAISFLFNVIISLFLSFQGYYLSLPFFSRLLPLSSFLFKVIISLFLSIVHCTIERFDGAAGGPVGPGFFGRSRCRVFFTSSGSGSGSGSYSFSYSKTFYFYGNLR